MTVERSPRRNGRSAIARAATLLLVTLVIGGCASKVRSYRCLPDEEGVGTDPQRLWACNRDIVKRAAKGGKFSLREFEEATRFFERITSIPAETLSTPQGLLPGAGLRDSIRRWDTWCRDNCARLHWDPDSREVTQR